MKVHATLGCGFLESAYGDALEVEFSKAGVPFCREDDVRVYYDGQPLKTTYRADFTCFDRRFIVELKAVRNLTGIEIAQVRHYMKATNAPYALLINFAREQLQYETFVLNDLRNVSGASEESEFLKTGEKELRLVRGFANASPEGACDCGERQRNVSGASDKSEFVKMGEKELRLVRGFANASPETAASRNVSEASDKSEFEF